MSVFLLVGFLLGATPAAPTTNWAEATIDLAVPSELEATGEHGTVIVEGDVTTDARVSNARVARSSRSQALDAMALKRFGNAKLAPDLLENHPAKVRLEVRFYHTQGFDLGKTYTCAQAVRDDDWHKAVFADQAVERTPLYLLMQSGGTLLGMKELAFAKDPVRFDQVWLAAIEACRSTPEAGFTQTVVRLGKK